jgi:ParB/RepB/Spo0J family partition protein
VTGGTLAVEQIAIDQLQPDPANPRRIADDELESLTRSLRQFGFVQPVLARRENRTVIGGHQRLVAARRLGWATVPVTWLDVSVEEARVLGLAALVHQEQDQEGICALRLHPSLHV